MNFHKTLLAVALAGGAIVSCHSGGVEPSTPAGPSDGGLVPRPGRPTPRPTANHRDKTTSHGFIGLGGQFRPLLAIENLFGISVADRKEEPAIGFRWNQFFPPSQRPGMAEYQAYLGSSLAGENRRKEQFFQLSFAPINVTARDFEDVIIAGHPWSDGEALESMLIIERWKLTYPDGALVARRPLSPFGVGQPWPYQRCEVSITNGNFVPIDELQPIVEERSLLHFGADFAALTSMVVDPDGRFLLLALEDGSLHRMDLAAPHEVQQIASVEDSPGLHRCQDLSFAQHSLHGRICIASRNTLGDPALDDAGMKGDQARSVFIDSQNDGIFEDVLELPDGTWRSSAVRDRTNWIDGFRVDVDAIFK